MDHHHGHAIVLHRLLKCPLHFQYLPGVHLGHMPHTHRPGQGGEIELDSRLTLEGDSRACMDLLSRHSGGAVVQDDNGILAIIIDRVNQPRDASVDESRIADDGHCPLNARLLEAVGVAHAGAHAVVDMYHSKGRQRAHGVAADVAGHHGVQITQGMIDGTVQTASAEHGVTGWDGNLLAKVRGELGAFDGSLQPLGTVFADGAEERLAHQIGHPSGGDLLLQKSLPLFNDVNLLKLPAEGL